MAKKKIIETTVENTASETVRIETPESKPEPVLNRGPFGWVKVRAKAHLGEPDRDGNMRHRKPGDVFEVPEARAPSLAGLVDLE